MTVTNIFIPPRAEPIKLTDFANSMTDRIKSLNPDFHCGGKIRNGFIQYGAAYNDCVHMNSLGQNTQIVIPAPTGSGKSVSGTLYLAQIARMDMSGLLVVSEVSVAIEAAETINIIAGEEVAGVHHSVSDKNPINDLWHPIEDLPRITIITHAMFKQRSDSGKDIHSLRSFREKQRDIIIIDERIDLIKLIRFGTDEVIDAVAILKRDPRLHVYAEIITDFNDEIFTANTNRTYKYDGKFQEYHLELTKDLRTILNRLEAGEYNLLQRLRGKKRNSESDRTNVKNLLSRMIYVISDRFNHTVEGNNITCHREENLSDKFGSVVVLDATAHVNPDYKFREVNDHDIMMFGKIASRDYSNVTLNICSLKGPNQSKTAIYTIPNKQNRLSEIIHCYLRVIGGILAPDDKLLVATYKDIVPVFAEHNPYSDQVKFIHWGSKDARGSNEFKDYNKAMVIGWFRRPAYFYVSSVRAINQVENYISYTGRVSSDANYLRNMLIVDDMIQFFNRVRCRTAVDDKGGCLPVELYCLTGGNEPMEKVIRTSIQAEMPSIVIKDWKPTELKVLKQKHTKNDERAKNFVMWLRCKIGILEEVSLAELRMVFGYSASIVSKAVKTDFFKSLLEEEGITMIKEKGRGNPARFILPRN